MNIIVNSGNLTQVTAAIDELSSLIKSNENIESNITEVEGDLSSITTLIETEYDVIEDINTYNSIVESTDVTSSNRQTLIDMAERIIQDCKYMAASSYVTDESKQILTAYIREFQEDINDMNGMQVMSEDDERNMKRIEEIIESLRAQ